MPTITVDGKSAEFSEDKRLVLAIKELGISIGHRCGGMGRCTTCQVTISDGEPDTMTQAEYDKLTEKGLYGDKRLSCQMTCSQDMTMEAVMTLETMEAWTDTGKMPADDIQPDASMKTKAELEA